MPNSERWPPLISRGGPARGLARFRLRRFCCNVGLWHKLDGRRLRTAVACEQRDHARCDEEDAASDERKVESRRDRDIPGHVRAKEALGAAGGDRREDREPERT